MDPNEKWNMKQWKQLIEKIGKDRLAILLIGGLLILETLIINNLYQYHPPSPTWEDGE